MSLWDRREELWQPNRVTKQNKMERAKEGFHVQDEEGNDIYYRRPRGTGRKSIETWNDIWKVTARNGDRVTFCNGTTCMTLLLSAASLALLASQFMGKKGKKSNTKCKKNKTKGKKFFEKRSGWLRINSRDNKIIWGC